MFLVDTNVITETTRAQPVPSVVGWLRAQQALKISAVSVYELEFGIAKTSGKKRDALTRWLESLLSTEGVEVVSVDGAIARAAGQLRQRMEEAGRPRPPADLLIAATALVSGSVLATRNVRDFEGAGVPLLDPFLAR